MTVRGEARGGRVAVIDTTTGAVIASVNVGGRAAEFTEAQLQETADAIARMRDAAIQGKTNPTRAEGGA